MRAGGHSLHVSNRVFHSECGKRVVTEGSIQPALVLGQQVVDLGNDRDQTRRAAVVSIQLEGAAPEITRVPSRHSSRVPAGGARARRARAATSEGSMER